MLTDIEHKVASLLDTCKDQGLGDCGATQQEAEALSWKLKTVKCNLEKVQMMLQEKYSEDQVSLEWSCADIAEPAGSTLAGAGKANGETLSSLESHGMLRRN